MVTRAKRANNNKWDAANMTVLGVSNSSAYELMHEKGFPALRIGSRLVVPKEDFQHWVKERMGQ